MSKVYDRAYFEHWYRSEAGVRQGGSLARRVALAVAVAEYHLERPIESVLDVGCGEGAWRGPLLRLRPHLAYLGLDASEYAVARWGRRRNLALADFADLEHLRPCAPVDLLVCADVMHYLPTRTLRRGLPGIAALCGGVAYLESYAQEDEIEGDLQGFQRRSGAWYRRVFAAVGLRAIGSHCYLGPAMAGDAASLEAI